jgi:hypothetical protein
MRIKPIAYKVPSKYVRGSLERGEGEIIEIISSFDAQMFTIFDLIVIVILKIFTISSRYSLQLIRSGLIQQRRLMSNLFLIFKNGFKRTLTLVRLQKITLNYWFCKSEQHDCMHGQWPWITKVCSVYGMDESGEQCTVVFALMRRNRYPPPSPH